MILTLSDFPEPGQIPSDLAQPFGFPNRNSDRRIEGDISCEFAAFVLRPIQRLMLLALYSSAWAAMDLIIKISWI